MHPVTDGGSRGNRWELVGAYALVASANQLLWLTFAPITSASAHHYHVSEGAIGLLSEIFPLLYVLLAVPAASALDRWFRPALLAGAVLTALGSLVRLGGDTFAWAMAGQLLIAVAQPLVLNAVTGLASGYLTSEARPLGIALGSAGIFLGMLISLASAAIVGGAHLHGLLVMGAVYGVVAALALAISLARSGRPFHQEKLAGLDGLRAVWRNPVVRRLSGIGFIGFGIFVALTTWLQPLLKPAGVSSTTAGWLLVTMVLCGVIGSAVLPPLVARADADRRLFMAASLTTATACAVFAFWQWVPIVALGVALTGLLLLTCLPVILELAETSAGAAGTSATALIWLSGNLGGIVIALLVQAVLHQPTVAFLLMAVIAAGVAGMLLFEPAPMSSEPAEPMERVAAGGESAEPSVLR
jgi:predicted MFS family arabinose efflux permease